MQKNSTYKIIKYYICFWKNKTSKNFSVLKKNNQFFFLIGYRKKISPFNFGVQNIHFQLVKKFGHQT